jgi:hypothetical protein
MKKVNTLLMSVTFYHTIRPDTPDGCQLQFDLYQEDAHITVTASYTFKTPCTARHSLHIYTLLPILLRHSVQPVTHWISTRCFLYFTDSLYSYCPCISYTLLLTTTHATIPMTHVKLHETKSIYIASGITRDSVNETACFPISLLWRTLRKKKVVSREAMLLWTIKTCKQH